MAGAGERGVLEVGRKCSRGFAQVKRMQILPSWHFQSESNSEVALGLAVRQRCQSR